MNISIIIPNYNGEDLMKKNLPKVVDSVAEYRDGLIEIIIPDDASNDNSVEVVQHFIKSLKIKNITVKLIENKKRTEGGFSKNVNRGVRAATGDILLLLNSDVTPHKGFLKELLKHFKNREVFAVGCMDESSERGKIVLRGRGIGSWNRGFLVHRKGSVDKMNTLWVSCGSGAFKREIWNKLGGLNELYNPFYWEDIDLSYRALKSGYTLIFESKSIVLHEHSKGSIEKNFSNYNKIKIVYRNQFTFVWINATDLAVLYSHFFWMPYHIIKALIRKDKAFFWGLLHALLRLRSIISYREKVRKMFIKSDKDIISQFTE